MENANGLIGTGPGKIVPYKVEKNVTKDFTELRSVNNWFKFFLLINALNGQPNKLRN